VSDAALERLPRLRVGVPREYFSAGLDAEVAEAVRAAVEQYRALGAEVGAVSLPHLPHAIATYYVVATAEASGNLARFDGVHYGRRAADPRDIHDLYCRSRSEGFGAEVKRRIMLGTFTLSAGYWDAYYHTALKVRRLIRADFDRAFEHCDVIAGPTTPTPAFGLGEKLDDPLEMYLEDVYTIAPNLAGLPAVSLPCGFSAAGLPIGLQLAGPVFGEARLLQAARLYERATEWHRRQPTLGAV
jgi:aspartyl-tRNA(Asn)/glutamyl-tRNA(Gln) amidotransferase subunit A